MNRRAFLTTTSAAFAAGQLPRHMTGRAPAVPLTPCGIQLYTVRRLMSQEAARTLAALAEIGYREVELAGRYGKSAAEFRRLLDANGLTAPATHIGLAELRSNLSMVLADAAALGHRWIIVPSLSAEERTVVGLEQVAAFLNKAGETARHAGMKIGYHNHGSEFARLPDGRRGFDILLQQTDPALVDFELDLFWIRQGGGDALAYFTQHPRRFAAVHVKDMSADGKMVNVGAGAIDFAAIIKQREHAGIQHFFVEHDQPADPLNDVRASFVAMQRLLNQR